MECPRAQRIPRFVLSFNRVVGNGVRIYDYSKRINLSADGSGGGGGGGRGGEGEGGTHDVTLCGTASITQSNPAIDTSALSVNPQPR